MFDKLANKDYMLAYFAARAAFIYCPEAIVMINDEMARKAGLEHETELGGLPIERDDDCCELGISATGESGKSIMMVFDREWNAFRCVVTEDPETFEGASHFKVFPQDVPDFLHEATMF